MRYIRHLSGQALRFGIVGVVSNMALYVIYLVLVECGIDSKVVVTVLYVVGLSITFVFNKRWSFSHRGGLDQSVKRYLILYGSLYTLHVIALYILVDVSQFPHALAQACVVIVFVPIVFLMQRFWVFGAERPAGR
uniref:Flippase GtrA (Transmembrane translocase of bactoprenol-linked glucose) n=1 Tax=Candidatus Kentrum sp. FM TaxID=2126340 RepID=A0A450W7K9_9GAMM|nr:MAG: Putative flippase GtrA (transmembrane translocase of bactoprenol-linked glucose) [Candidatus Kentron sp. FM]VFJ75378.1 MAG: Putative flippase GtrA (transmembrane translocase of bactoprenol-linked glucose) [Candidatus Kentron sp. FM]VFK12901.1 MAG: Putative flippase GtrA (transmembrane translocase of bactoprenol-linked glucose) [Candidatus Kentron sp. FM]